jgi:MFS family permease
MSELSVPDLPPEIIQRAVRLSYAQAMVGSIYVASTGGMFLIGYALKLGANNVQIGLMSTVPMFFVVMQLVSAALVERGVSRRKMTILGALANVSCWALVILIPYVAARATPGVRVGALIGIIALVTVFGHIWGNARGSWLGDLIPADFRGRFFGGVNMYAGIVGAVFALIEGAFLDRVEQMGIGAFGWLFGFGMLFGLVTALLFVPQPDIPIARRELRAGFLGLVREAFANRGLMLVLAFGLLWSMQSIASPFFATYMLRDLKMPFLGVGLVNSVATLTFLASSPFWGRVVDRYGCRPVLVACTGLVAPLFLIWIIIASARAAYLAIPPVNLLLGFGVGGISVAINTLLFKVTSSAGRAVQLALYSIIVVLAASPMPTLGGYLPDWLNGLGIHADLRATFYASSLFILAAACAARYIKEPDSRRIAELVRNLPGHLRRPSTLTGPDP